MKKSILIRKGGVCPFLSEKVENISHRKKKYKIKEKISWILEKVILNFLVLSAEMFTAKLILNLGVGK